LERPLAVGRRAKAAALEGEENFVPRRGRYAAPSRLRPVDASAAAASANRSARERALIAKHASHRMKLAVAALAVGIARACPQYLHR
jgi:hypothetical protein